MSFDPHLVNQLRREHAELLVIVERLLEAAGQAQMDAIGQDLNLLRQAYLSHLQVENLKYYAYMDRHLTNSPLEQRALHNRRREANQVARGVAEFIHHWVTAAPNKKTLPVFIEQLRNINAQLAQRIEIEENVLLPMYS